MSGVSYGSIVDKTIIDVSDECFSEIRQLLLDIGKGDFVNTSSWKIIDAGKFVIRNGYKMEKNA